MSSSDVSVVLVHGAWADGSSSAKVIAPLAAEGFVILDAARDATRWAKPTELLRTHKTVTTQKEQR